MVKYKQSLDIRSTFIRQILYKTNDVVISPYKNMGVGVVVGGYRVGGFKITRSHHHLAPKYSFISPEVQPLFSSFHDK